MLHFCNYDCHNCHDVGCGVYQGYLSVDEKRINDEKEKFAHQEKMEKLISEKGILGAVTENGEALEFASKEDRNEKNIVLMAVLSCPSSFVYASNTLKDDVDVVTLAVSLNSFNYILASERLKKYKQIALLAMANDCRIYNNLDESFKDDPEILFLSLVHLINLFHKT